MFRDSGLESKKIGVDELSGEMGFRSLDLSQGGEKSLKQLRPMGEVLSMLKILLLLYISLDRNLII